MTERRTWLVTYESPLPKLCRRAPSCPPGGAEQGHAPCQNLFGLFRGLWDITNTSGSICKLMFRKCMSPISAGLGAEAAPAGGVMAKRSLENTKQSGLHPKIKRTKTLIRSRHTHKKQTYGVNKHRRITLTVRGNAKPGAVWASGAGRWLCPPSARAGPGGYRSPAALWLPGEGRNTGLEALGRQTSPLRLI